MRTSLLSVFLFFLTITGLAQIAENDFNFVITGTGFNGKINAMVVQPDGKIVVGGAFTSYNGTTRNYIARLDADGTLDNTFDATSALNAPVLTVALQSTGNIIVGGSFGGALKRLDATTGIADGTFNLTGGGLAATGYVSCMAVQSDDKIVVGGTFTQYDATSRNRIVRLTSNGSLDGTFNPGTGLNGQPRSIAIQSDGKVIAVGGSSGFSSYDGTSRDNIVRIESTGAIDATFVPPSNLLARLYDVKIQLDDKILITGEYNGNINSAFSGVARLTTNGAFDNAFTPTYFQGGRSIAIQSDGKIVIGGIANGSNFPKAVKFLNSNGTDDTSFTGDGFYDASVSHELTSLVVQGDKIVAGGFFGSYNGNARKNMARIATCSSVGFTLQPQAKAVCENNPFSFSVVATGSSLSYQWQAKGADNIYSNIGPASLWSGMTTATLVVDQAFLSVNNSTYRCLVSDGTCTSTSTSATLTVSISPTINAHPTPSAKCPGENTTFNVSVTNAGSYQWQQDAGSGFENVTNGGVYSGATTATLSLTGITGSMSTYKFRCVVGNCNPSVVSNEATLTVNSAPVITEHPQTPSIICTGSNVQFSAAATNASGYQWQEKIGAGSFSDITDGGIYSGTTTATLTLSGATVTQHGRQYRCVAQNASACETPSNAATLSVYATPAVSTHPANATKCAGATATFTVAVTSPVAGLTYQWQEKVGSGSYTNLTNGGVYSTVTTATLSLAGVTADMNGNKYRCIVGTCPVPVTSFEADLIVDSPPVVTLQPQESIICAGMGATFSTDATGVGATFQWQKSDAPGSLSFINVNNGGIYSGATTETLTLTEASINDDSYRYRCVVTVSGACPAVNTGHAYLRVRSIPTFNSQPANLSVCEGQQKSFTAQVNFAGAPSTYQWQVDKTGDGFIDLEPDITLYGNGVTSSGLVISPTFSMNGYKYRVRVGECEPAVYSASGTLNVSQPPVITEQPANQTVCENESATFSVTATGTDLKYQWFNLNGSGMQTSTLTIENVSVTMDGISPYCVVSGTNGCAAVTSSLATLKVNNLEFTNEPQTVNPFCPGGSVSYSATAVGPGLTYQWQVDNGTNTGFTDIENGGVYGGVTTGQLNLTNVPVEMRNYKYRCVAKGLCGEVNSSVVLLQMFFTPPKPVIQAGEDGSGTILTLNSGGESIKWFQNGTQVGSNSTTLNVTAEGSYTAQVTINGCMSPLSDAKVMIVTGDLENSIDSKDVFAYPNPVAHRLTISLKSFPEGQEVNISVHDLFGRIIDKSTAMGGGSKELDVSAYSPGRYAIILQRSQQKAVAQFVKTN